MVGTSGGKVQRRKSGKETQGAAAGIFCAQRQHGGSRERVVAVVWAVRYAGTQIEAPAARFLQWKAVIHDGGRGTELIG